MRAMFIIFSCSIGAIGAYFAAPYVYKNNDAITILVNVYTVFAGFLVAIIALLGDPIMIPSGSWQTAENNRDNIESRIYRYSYLFGLYLITLCIIFIGVLLKDAPEDVISSNCKEWIAKSYLFFGITAFILSFALPKTLMDLQKHRVDEEIKRRRKSEGIQE